MMRSSDALRRPIAIWLWRLSSAAFERPILGV
jgi:hypothetical protein